MLVAKTFLVYRTSFFLLLVDWKPSRFSVTSIRRSQAGTTTNQPTNEPSNYLFTNRVYLISKTVSNSFLLLTCWVPLVRAESKSISSKHHHHQHSPLRTTFFQLVLLLGRFHLMKIVCSNTNYYYYCHYYSTTSLSEKRTFANKLMFIVKMEWWIT